MRLGVIGILILAMSWCGAAPAGAQEVDEHWPCDDQDLADPEEIELCDPSGAQRHQRDFDLPPLAELGGRGGSVVRVQITGAYDAPYIVMDAVARAGAAPRLIAYGRNYGALAAGHSMQAILSPRQWRTIERGARRAERAPALAPNPPPSPSGDPKAEIIICEGMTMIVELYGFGRQRMLMRFPCRPPEPTTDFVQTVGRIAVRAFARCPADDVAGLVACQGREGDIEAAWDAEAVANKLFQPGRSDARPGALSPTTHLNLAEEANMAGDSVARFRRYFFKPDGGWRFDWHVYRASGARDGLAVDLTIFLVDPDWRVAKDDSVRVAIATQAWRHERDGNWHLERMTVAPFQIVSWSRD